MSQGTSSLIGQAAGAVSGAVGAYTSASSTKLGINLQAYMAGLNAKAMEDNARHTVEAGNEAQTSYMLGAAQVKSSQRAAMGANGVDMSTGSALTRQVSDDYIAETDRNTIALNALREASGYRTQATNFSNEALMKKAEANSISPFLAGVASLATSAGMVSSDWYQMKKLGMFDGSKGSASGGGYGGSFNLSGYRPATLR